MEKVSLYRRFRGLTLIELMIVLMVIAITLSLSAPLMQDLLQGNRLRSESIRFLRAKMGCNIFRSHHNNAMYRFFVKDGLDILIVISLVFKFMPIRRVLCDFLGATCI